MSENDNETKEQILAKYRKELSDMRAKIQKHPELMDRVNFLQAEIVRLSNISTTP